MKYLILFLLMAAPLSAQNNEEPARRPRSIDSYTAYIRSLTNIQRITDVGNEAVNAVGPRFDIYTAIGDAYMAANDPRRAVNAYRLAQSVNPRSATGYNRMGLSLLRIGSYRQAEVAFKAAASYTGSINARGSYLANVGLALENSSEWEQASLAYNEALKVNPANTLAKEGRDRLAPRLAQTLEAKQQ